jgi:hypothetical protein
MGIPVPTLTKLLSQYRGARVVTVQKRLFNCFFFKQAAAARQQQEAAILLQ